MAAETALREAATPGRLANPLRDMPTYSIARDAFLLRLPSGLTFHYAQGKGVTFSRPGSVSDLEVSLFLNGSVYGAIAWINGLVPLHASAVVHDGRVHAFTGQSGAGKSTLTAALGAHGFPMLADDVLVLDLSDPETAMCLPGHKQLKLWGDALALTGLESTGPVREELDKHYVAPSGGIHPQPLPLSHLYFLSENARTQPSLNRLSGATRLTQARAAFYRPRFCAALTGNVDLFALLSRLAVQVEMIRFDRPRRKDMFADGIAAMAAAIRAA